MYLCRTMNESLISLNEMTFLVSTQTKNSTLVKFFVIGQKNLILNIHKLEKTNSFEKKK